MTTNPEPTDEQVKAAWMKATDPRRQAPIRRLYEDAALDVVTAIKRDYLPDMDENDGGQLLSWLLDLVAMAVLTEVDRDRVIVLSLPAADAEEQ